MSEGGAFSNEYPPAPNMYYIQRTYYPNGYLKSKGALIGEYLKIGLWKYYDEHGKLTKEVNEDDKFGEIKLKWILDFAEKAGIIDQKTGKGREELINNGNFGGYQKRGSFTLGFYSKGEYPPKYNDYPLWVIQEEESPANHFYQTTYQIHGDTGVILSKKRKQIHRDE